MVTEKEPLVMTVKGAARLVGVSEATMRSAIRLGQVPTVRVGKLQKVPRARLLQALGVNESEDGRI